MKVLFLSFYFPPDLSAGSFRADALVNELASRLPGGASLDVITTRPNRYASVEISAPNSESRGIVRIERVPLPPHKSGMRDQARAFLTYARGVRRLTAGQRYDLVIATSSRLMTAVLGAFVAKRVGGRLYLDIRDIFVDTLKDVLPGWRGRFVLPAFDILERWAIRRAACVNIVSEGFRSYFEQRYPGVRLDCFTNGVDDAFISDEWRPTAGSTDSVVKVLYAGNIGEGQGLHRILPELSVRAGQHFQFVVVGDGGRRSELENALTAAGANNVELRAPVPRSKLLDMYREADILFLHLNDYEAFAKVLPSKLFEYAATGKPILAGVGGYADVFTRTEVQNAAVFSPCDVPAGLAALLSLTIAWTDRSAFIARFQRSRIMRDMSGRILDVALQ